MATIDTLMAGRTVLLVTHGAHHRIQDVLRLDRGRLVRRVERPVAEQLAVEPPAVAAPWRPDRGRAGGQLT